MISIYPEPTEQVSYADTASLDAFGRLRVSEALTIFNAQQEYGLDTTATWDATANGVIATSSSDASVTSGSNAVGPTSSSTRMTPITVSTTNGHYSIIQSKGYFRYIPGKSHLVLITGIFASGASSTASIVVRSSTSGSVVDNAVAQTSWNIDKFDGTGPSGITLDFTKTQIFFISAQWLGVGRVVCGFSVNGRLYPAHQFLHANVLTVPYAQTFNLPVRMEIRNTGAAESTARAGYFDASNGVFLQTVRAVAGGTVNMICCSVQSEGGQVSRGFSRSAAMGTSSVSVTTRRPILSIRPKATFNSRTNRGLIVLSGYEATAATNAAFIEIVLGGTLTGAAFASLGTASITEFDTAATAISGGIVLDSGYVAAGAGAARAATSQSVDFRNPLVLSQIDALTATQTPLTLVATSLTGTSSVTASLNFFEEYI